MKSLPYLQRHGQWNGYPTYGTLLFLMTLGHLQQPQLVSGFSCYECTSEQPGCEQEMTTSEKFGRVCDGGAIGCGVYAYELNFILPTVFHRGCTYPVDLDQYLWYSPGNEPKGEKHIICDRGLYYGEIFEKWNKTRQTTKDPVPLQVQNYPTEYGPFRYYFQDASRGELSNSISLSEWRKTWKDKISMQPKRKESIECYSCDAELGETELKKYFSGPGNNGVGKQTEMLPSCPDTKTVTCRDVYGCATIYMTRDPVLNEWGWWRDNKYKVSRIWRGCWAPGEMKCLIKDSQNGRSLQTNNSKVKSRQADECENAYLRSYKDGKGEVAWGGIQKLNTQSDYNRYLECKHQARRFVRVDDGWMEDDGEVSSVDGWTEYNYAHVQYRFCGPKAKCNRDKNNPAGNDEEKKVEENKCETEDEGFNGNDFESCDCTVTEDETNTAQFSKWTSNTSKILWSFVTVLSVILPRL